MINFIEEMQKRFNSTAAQGLNAIYLFEIGESQSYGLHVNNGEFHLLKELPSERDITLSVDEKTWNDILTGKTPAQMAFMMGKLKVQGDISLALKLANIFKLS